MLIGIKIEIKVCNEVNQLKKMYSKEILFIVQKKIVQMFLGRIRFCLMY